MSQSGICAIEGCGKKRKAYPKGSSGFYPLCTMHLERRRKGFPMDAPCMKRPSSELDEFFEKAVACKDDACLIWPFKRHNKTKYAIWTRTTDGGKVVRGRRSPYIAREICYRLYGEPPTPEHQAAHSCGKGHEGCVNGSHLRWATPSENENDKKGHGTYYIRGYLAAGSDVRGLGITGPR